MTLKELRIISATLHSLADFATSNTGADESGIGVEMLQEYAKSEKIIANEFYKLHLRNELARRKKNSKLEKNT